MERPSTGHSRAGHRSFSALRRPRTAVQIHYDTSQLPDPFDETVPDVPDVPDVAVWDTVVTPEPSFPRRRFLSHGQQEMSHRPAICRKSLVGLNTLASSAPTSGRNDKRTGSSRLSGLFKHKSRESLGESSNRASSNRTPVAPNWFQRAANVTFGGRRRSHVAEPAATNRNMVVDTPEGGSPRVLSGPLPLHLRGGDAARAAAAASNEQLEEPHFSPREISRVREAKSNDDNESGIGIDVQQVTEAGLTAMASVSRIDPASLPEELFHHMLSFLDAPSLMAALRVSRRWQLTAGSRAIWREVFGVEFGRHAQSAASTAVSGRGIGTGQPDQDWKRMWSVRQALEARWQDGHAAAIYLEGHGDSVYCVQFDEEKIVTGSRDRTIRVWDLHTFACIKVLGRPKTAAGGAVTGTPVLSGRMQRQRPFVSLTPALAHCVSPAAQVGALHHTGSVLCLKFDATTMVTGSSDTTLICWDIGADWAPAQRLVGHSAGVLDVCFDAQHIVSCSKDTTIAVWARDSGQLVARLSGHLGPVNAVQLRGAHVASASGDGVARLWHLPSGACVKEFPSRDRGLACVEFSPDGRTLLAGGNDHVIYQFDANTGELVRELAGHANLVRSLHLDAAAGRVISGSYDYSVKAWDLRAKGRLLCDFAGWTTSWMLAAMADYRRIVATSQDGRVVVMDFGHALPGVDLLAAVPRPPAAPAEAPLVPVPVPASGN